MNDYFGILTRRSVHPASPVLITKNGPLESIIIFSSDFTDRAEQITFLTHLKFENKSSMFHAWKNDVAHGLRRTRQARLLLIIRFTRSNYFV